MAEAERLVVTGVGARTPVGTTAVQTCAALRAGISRLREWPRFGIAGEPLRAAAVDDRDLPWVAKGMALFQPALEEAMWQSNLYDLSWHAGSRLGLFLATPPEDRAGVEREDYAEFMDDLQDVWAETTESGPLILYCAEQVGGAVALSEAMTALISGELDVAIVGGLESHMSSLHLEALFADSKLQIGGRPAGLVPGEAAGCLVVESAAHARSRGARPLLQVGALALESEDPGWTPARPIRGAALSRALDAVLAVSPGPAEVHRVIVDHTGERWRFSEWATVEARNLSGLSPGWKLWHTADGIGDSGAAFVPLAGAMAVAARARGYAGPGNILVAASAASGERAALVFTPP